MGMGMLWVRMNIFHLMIASFGIGFGLGLVSFDPLAPLAPSYPPGGEFGHGVIDLGGLQVYEALYFNKIWETHNGGADGFGASFYEPASIPSGFHLLGHYSEPNGKPLFASVLVAKDATGDPNQGALKPPIGFTLIWTSKGLNIEKEDAYIWLPIPPLGYKPIGHILTTSPQKPSPQTVMCVRSDFTDAIQPDQLIWGLNRLKEPVGVIDVYTTKPVSRELSIPAGTFLARVGDWVKNELGCLKMVKKEDRYSAMPNSLQIKTIINAYAPWVYFHPDEQYFPSTVLWFFQNWAELYRRDQYPQPMIGHGTNLPNNGPLDDAFLDLPNDQTAQDRLKKGFLEDAVAYVHVKPALGGTFTDLAVWLYYPFNGGGKFQLGPFAIDLGIIGEHVSDWEHITLRVDNYRGVLKAVYLSQHVAGKWLTAREIEFVNGSRPVVYASLHGHLHYPFPGPNLHTSWIDPTEVEALYEELKKYSDSSKAKGGKLFGVGLRDDTDKSEKVFDIASSYNVVCVDYKKGILAICHVM